MAPELLLLLDVGNTNTKIALADENGLAASYTLPTNADCTPDSWGLDISSALGHAGATPADLSRAAASSVVPPANPCLKKAVEKYFGLDLAFVPADLALDLKNSYARPQEVGADRLVTAFAARRLLPEAQNIIVIDFGTATTFDCVGGDAYLGGLICPGVRSSARALASATAKLPRITLEVDSNELHVGRSTSQSLNQGFVFGFASMVEGLVARLRGQLGADAPVVATGGFAEALAPACPCMDKVRPDLLMEGLRLAVLEAGETKPRTP